MRGVIFVLPLMIGLLFMTGRGLVFGITGTEPTIVMLPENHAVGWVFIGFSIVWLFPPWTTVRISRGIKFIISRIRGERLRSTEGAQ